MGRPNRQTALDYLDSREELLVQCINPFSEPVQLSAGTLVGKYHSIHETNVGPALKTVAGIQRIPTQGHQGAVPECVIDCQEDLLYQPKEALSSSQSSQTLSAIPV